MTLEQRARLLQGVDNLRIQPWRLNVDFHCAVLEESDMDP